MHSLAHQFQAFQTLVLGLGKKKQSHSRTVLIPMPGLYVILTGKLWVVRVHTPEAVVKGKRLKDRRRLNQNSQCTQPLAESDPLTLVAFLLLVWERMVWSLSMSTTIDPPMPTSGGGRGVRGRGVRGSTSSSSAGGNCS